MNVTRFRARPPRTFTGSQKYSKYTIGLHLVNGIVICHVQVFRETGLLHTKQFLQLINLQLFQ